MQERLNPSIFSYLPIFLIRIQSSQIPLRFILVRSSAFVFSNKVTFAGYHLAKPFD